MELEQLTALMGLKSDVIKVYWDAFNTAPGGLYNHGAATYNISVDGELMRHSGLFDQNIQSHNPEEAISHSAYKATQSVIDRLVNFIGKTPNKILIYMDGTRVPNKVEREYTTSYNHKAVRAEYCNRIRATKEYTLVQLESGEAELNMYLLRDKSVGLNAFITRDSDMLSILYDHQPIVEHNKGTVKCREDHRLTNYNNQYVDGSIVRDSCLWFNNNFTTPTMFGMDNTVEHLMYNRETFRILCALSGTDFTNHGLTKKCVESLLNLPVEDKIFLNGLDPFEKYIGILIFAVKCKAQLVREKPEEIHGFNMNGEQIKFNIENNFNAYNKYLTTGEMGKMSRLPMTAITKLMIYCMVGKRTTLQETRSILNHLTNEQIIKNTLKRLPYCSPTILRSNVDIFGLESDDLTPTAPPGGDEVSKILEAWNKRTSKMKRPKRINKRSILNTPNVLVYEDDDDDLPLNEIVSSNAAAVAAASTSDVGYNFDKPSKDVAETLSYVINVKRKV